MTLARTWSVGLAGVHGALVEVEVDMAAGVPQVVLVGLPDAVVRQSVDRVRAAVVNAGGSFPQRRITIGLSPAAMPKQGSGFDLALVPYTLSRPDVFAGTVTEKLFIYALGRPVHAYDMPMVRTVVRRAAKDGNRFSALLLGIVESDAFQKRLKKP